MKRPKGAGYRMDPKWRVRPVDQWRKWAAVPFPDVSVRSSHRPGEPIESAVYTITEDGVLVGTWRHADAPWLYDWMRTRTAQLHGAWHVARGARPLLAGQQRSGAKQAKANKAAARKARAAAAPEDARLRKRALAILDANPPLTHEAVAELMADAGYGDADELRRKLPKLLNRKA